MYNFAQYYREFRGVPMHAQDDSLRLIPMAVCFVVVLLGMWLVYRMFISSKWAYQSQDPLEIAKGRYAKGEITKTELAEIRKEIKA